MVCLFRFFFTRLCDPQHLWTYSHEQLPGEIWWPWHCSMTMGAGSALSLFPRNKWARVPYCAVDTQSPQGCVIGVMGLASCSDRRCDEPHAPDWKRQSASAPRWCLCSGILVPQCALCGHLLPASPKSAKKPMLAGTHMHFPSTGFHLLSPKTRSSARPGCQWRRRC